MTEGSEAESVPWFVVLIVKILMIMAMYSGTKLRPVHTSNRQNISACFNSAMSGEAVVGRDGKVIEGMRRKIEGQTPMFDVTTRSGQTHTFRVSSKTLQSRLTCSLDNDHIENQAQGEHGAWVSAISREAGLAARRVGERKSIAAVAAGSSNPLMLAHAQAQDKGERGGQGWEQHYAPSCGLYVRQEARHLLPSRQHNKRMNEGDQQVVVEGHKFVSTFIANTQEQGPAERAGLQIGDELVEVDSRNIEKMEWPSVLALLEGSAASTQVAVKVKRLSAVWAGGNSDREASTVLTCIIHRQSEFQRLQHFTERGSGWGDAAAMSLLAPAPGDESTRGTGAGGAGRRMGKWQRDGSWYTEGAELLDETSSGETDYDTAEEDKAMYATWKAHAQASGKEIYTPGREKGTAVPRGSRATSGAASARSNRAALNAPGLGDGRAEHERAEQEVLWNPVQAKFELMELSHRKQTLQQRLNAINRRAHLYKRVSREAQEKAEALQQQNKSLRHSCSKVCSEMAALHEEHEHLAHTHQEALHSLDVTSREVVILRHENALLSRLYYMDQATGLLPKGFTLGGDQEIEQDMQEKAGLMIDLAATQASLATLRKARRRDAADNCVLYDYAQAAWREERERMVCGYKEAMELRDRALHQASCAIASEQKLRAQGQGLQLQVRALNEELNVVKGRALRLIHPTSTATLEALASEGAGGGVHGDAERGQREAELEGQHPTLGTPDPQAPRPPVLRQADAGGAPDPSNQVDLEKFMREVSAAGALHQRQQQGSHASALASAFMPRAAAGADDSDDCPSPLPTPTATSSKLSPGALAATTATWSLLDVPVAGSMAEIEHTPAQDRQDVSAHSLAAQVDSLVQRHQGHVNERHHAMHVIANGGAQLQLGGASLASRRQVPRQRSPGACRAGRIKTAAETFIEERLGNVVVDPAAQPLVTSAALSLSPRAISGWDVSDSAGGEEATAARCYDRSTVYDRTTVDRYLAQNNRTSLSLNSQNRLVYDFHAETAPDTLADKTQATVPQVRAMIDWSRVSVHGVRADADTALVSASNAAAGPGSSGGGVAGGSWHRNADGIVVRGVRGDGALRPAAAPAAPAAPSLHQYVAGQYGTTEDQLEQIFAADTSEARAHVGDDRPGADTWQVEHGPRSSSDCPPQTLAAASSGSLDCALPASVPSTNTDAHGPLKGLAQGNLEEVERRRASLLRQERNRADIYVLDTRMRACNAGGRDMPGAGQSQSAPSSRPAAPVSAPARSSAGRPHDSGQGAGGADFWEGGNVLEGALRTIGWPSPPQVSSLERAVEEELLAQYTL